MILTKTSQNYQELLLRSSTFSVKYPSHVPHSPPVLYLPYRGIPLVSHDRNVRIAAIGCLLAGGDYDLVSLQEVWSEDNYHTIRDRVKEVLPYSHYFYR